MALPKTMEDMIREEARELYRRVYADVAGKRSQRVGHSDEFDRPRMVAHPIAMHAHTDYLDLFLPSKEVE